MKQQPVLKLSGVTKSYPSGDKELRVLDGVDFEMAEGEFVALRGPSGAGKTTLLQIAAGLDRPSGGEVCIAGHDLTDLPEREMTNLRRREIGFIFQFFNLVTGLNVLDNVALPLLFDGRPQAEIDQAVADAIAAVGLEQRSTHLAGDLSGGEMQRAAVARAIAPQPRLIFADEPTGNLDSHSGDLVLDLIAAASSDRKMAILMVTHDDRAASRADRVVEMRDGRLTPGSARPSEPTTSQTRAATV